MGKQIALHVGSIFSSKRREWLQLSAIGSCSRGERMLSECDSKSPVLETSGKKMKARFTVIGAYFIKRNIVCVIFYIKSERNPNKLGVRSAFNRDQLNRLQGIVPPVLQLHFLTGG